LSLRKRTKRWHPIAVVAIVALIGSAIFFYRHRAQGLTEKASILLADFVIVVTGDANQDGNNANDRLPGVRRNSFTGPDYATTDVRIARRIYAGDRLNMELVGESFNLLNRDNRRVLITEDGFQSNSASFAHRTKHIGINYFPAQYRVPNNVLHATSSYAPQQMQLALKLIY
jgi:hypothetical protein